MATLVSLALPKNICSRLIEKSGRLSVSTLDIGRRKRARRPAGCHEKEATAFGASRQRPFLTLKQVGRYLEGSHNNRCWSNKIHRSCIKTVDDRYICDEGDGAEGESKGMSPRFIQRYCPSGEKATEEVWPLSTLRHNPVAASHIRTVLSHDADATSCPSGECSANSNGTRSWRHVLILTVL
jgi:hypothetical protein